MSNRPSSSFSATDQRVYITNNRVPVFDFNTQEIKLDLSNNVVPILNDISQELQNLQVSLTGPIGLTGPVTIAPGSLVGITGPVGVTGSVSVSNFPIVQGVTGTVSLAPSTVVGITGPIQASLTTGITGSVSVSNFPIVQGVTGEVSLAPGTVVGITGPIQASLTTGITGSVSVSNFPAIQGVTGTVSLTTGTQVSLTGEYLYGNFIGVTGSFQSGPISIAPDNYIGITGLAGITGTVSLSAGSQISLTGPFLYNNGSLIGVTGSFSSTIAPGTFVSLTGTALTKDISANATLTLIEQDISGGILVKGQDDTGVRYPIYVDADGVQRTEIVSGHAETGKYIFETDATVIATGTSWGLDNRDREGWYFSGTVSSTLKWYGNNGISNPPSLQFSKAQSLWMIATLDDVTAAPKIRVITSASTWDYTIPSPGVTIYNGEQYVFYYGQKGIALNPSYHPILLIRTLVSGPGANSEVISEINVITGTATNFLLNKTGIWDQDLAQQFATVFRDIRAQTAEDNLISLDFSGTALITAIEGPVSLAAGTEVNSKLYATLAGTTTISEYVSVETAPYRPQFPSTQYVNELCTAAHLRANLWDPSFNYTTALQVFPSASLSATGPTGPARYSLSTTVDNPASSPLNVRVIGGITGTVNVSAATSSIQIADVCFNATVRPINPFSTNLGTTGVNGLVTDSALFGYNVSAGTVSLLTTDISGTRNQLQTRDADAVAELVTIDNKMVQQYNTMNDSSVNGLNIYQIRPKYRYYSMRGRSTVADANMIFGGVGNSRYFFSDAFGRANVKPWYAYSENVTRTVNYEYVDASGNIGNGTKDLSINTWTQLPLQSGSNGNFLINKWSQSINTSSATAQLYITHTTNNTAYSAFGGYLQDNYNSLFTVPNGYVACVTNVMFYSNAADDYLLMLRWSAAGLRDNAYYWTNAKYINQNYAGEFGGVGVVYTAGETIAFATLNTASYKDFSATVQLMPV